MRASLSREKKRKEIETLINAFLNIANDDDDDADPYDVIMVEPWIPKSLFLMLQMKKRIIFSPDFICRLKPNAEAKTASTTVNLSIMIQ